MRLQEGVEAIAVIWSKPFSLLLSICVCVCDRLCNLVYVCYGAYLNTIQSTNPLLEIWNALGLRSKEKKQTPVQVKHMPMCVCVCESNYCNYEVTNQYWRHAVVSVFVPSFFFYIISSVLSSPHLSFLFFPLLICFLKSSTFLLIPFIISVKLISSFFLHVLTAF